MSKTAYLILQNGRVFSGERFGADGDATAELVFTTGMAGYLETLTDPSYHGQMVVQTFPLIGNYGVISADFESKRPALSAYIVREACEGPSNFRSEGKLDDFLRETDVIGLKGVDTRALTRIIREMGTMNAAIVSEMPSDAAAFCRALEEMPVAADIHKVSVKEKIPLNEGGKYIVALWDFGYKAAMAKELMNRDCKVVVMPASATAKEIMALDPDGVLLSNGPGDPAWNVSVIQNIGLVAETGLPVMGICLGHQMLALARGAKSMKLKYGHRGANQPVRDLRSGRCYITSQNHGYAIDTKTLPEGAKPRFENMNDFTCEGVTYLDINAFSAQFHPEACAGPKDTHFLFDEFISMMGGGKHAR